MKYTLGTLKKIEELFEEARYRIRYEKGQFHSGYCILENQKIVVVNRFLDTESRINVFLDILPQLELNRKELSGEMLHFLQKQIQPELKKNRQKLQLGLDFEE